MPSISQTSGDGPARTLDAMRFDAASGVWRAELAGDLSGKYYRYAVDVIADGVGLVRNAVTDPYSVSLTTDSKRSYIANLAAPYLKPAGWDGAKPPARARRTSSGITSAALAHRPIETASWRSV